MRYREDIEFSIRLIASGYRTGLIENAFVYHKRSQATHCCLQAIQIAG